MPEIILELSLSRSSGMLAGIVASLAQAGIEFKSQKLKRATEGRGGWLTITGSGESPEPAVLADRLNGTRGVDKLMRVIVDGEAILAEGKPLEDQIQAGDLAELSAGSDSESDASVAAPEPPPTSDRAPETQAAAPRSGGERIQEYSAPDSFSESSVERDLADALQDEAEPVETEKTTTADEEDENPAQVGAVLRRRRRRRR